MAEEYPLDKPADIRSETEHARFLAVVTEYGGSAQSGQVYVPLPEDRERDDRLRRALEQARIVPWAAPCTKPGCGKGGVHMPDAENNYPPDNGRRWRCDEHGDFLKPMSGPAKWI